MISNSYHCNQFPFFFVSCFSLTTSTIDSSGELQYNSESTPTDETVIPAVEWNFAPKITEQNKLKISDPPMSTFLPSTIATESPYYLKVHSTELPNKRSSDITNDDPKPDLTISNVLASDSSKKLTTATIRKPHLPLKCPISEQHSEPVYVNQVSSRQQMVNQSFILTKEKKKI